MQVTGDGDWRVWHPCSPNGIPLAAHANQTRSQKGHQPFVSRKRVRTGGWLAGAVPADASYERSSASQPVASAAAAAAIVVEARRLTLVANPLVRRLLRARAPAKLCGPAWFETVRRPPAEVAVRADEGSVEWNAPALTEKSAARAAGTAAARRNILAVTW